MSDFIDRLSGLSPARLALLALELHETIAKAEQRTAEPIAVVGLGCRLPGGADTPEAFWKLLIDEVDAISEVPASRWDIDEFYDPDPQAPGRMSTRWGGFVEPIDRFDAAFFSIAPREALSLDPQQRLLLEVVWEALEHAGQSAAGLHGSRTGVFVGIGTSDYAHRFTRSGDLEEIDAYRATGCVSHSPASGRIAYVLGLQGPAVSVDTACSSSLVAVHLACQSLRNDECTMALAGGVNAILMPELSIGLSKAGMMAPDGRCKTFDASANGFVRGEGCGVVVLKRLSQAQADGDRVLALIRGSAVNQDGRSNGLTAPNGRAQEAVIREALARAAVAPGLVSYVEAHGTGTELGDPIEVQALGAALCESRPAATPLTIGSVKTNLGHLESAAGVTGLIKLVLALGHRTIPRSLHFSSPNPHVNWAQWPLRVAAATEPWEPIEGRRIGAVSAFGFSGTNAHVVVEEAPAVPPGQPSGRSREVLTLSARSETALIELAAKYAAALETRPQADLADVCFTSHVGRAMHQHRLALVADTTDTMAASLRAVAGGGSPAQARRGTVRAGHRTRIAWLFTGQGSPYPGMGRVLFESAPAFRDAFERVAAVLDPLLGGTLVAGVCGADGDRLSETGYAQPALFAFQYALAALWQSWGVLPDAVLGHSVGEFAAACVAGVLDMPTAARLVAARGRLMQALPADGAMAAVWADEATVRAAVPGVVLAAVNGPAAVVIAGEEREVVEACGLLELQGIATERLAVRHAFHTPRMLPMIARFEQEAAATRPAAARVPWISTVTGTWADAASGDAAYWTRQIASPVHYSRAVSTLLDEGFGAFVEIGPTATLVGLGRTGWPDADAVWAPSLRSSQDAWTTLLDTLGALWVRGVEVDWAGFDRARARSRVALPTYPFQRQRFWADAPPLRRGTEQISVPELAPEADANSTAVPAHYEVDWRPFVDDATEPDDSSAPLRSVRVLLDAEASALEDRLHVKDVSALEPQVDRLCAAYVQEALRALGWTPAPDDEFTSGELLTQLGIQPRYRQLVDRLLGMLAEDGWLRRSGSLWRVVGGTLDSSSAVLDALVRTASGFEAELRVLARCGSALAGVLSGRIDPLSLLFPDGSMADLEAVYGRSPLSEFHNALLAEAIAREVRARASSGVVRILEIGGGTASTTRHVLSRLSDDSVQYVFTDVSPFFTAAAAETFAAQRHVEARVLDIEQSPALQGFSGESFDVVIAANVLHATRDLRQTTAHVAQLAAPGALVLLWENVRAQRWIDLVFGLTDGWWRFADHERRSTHPLVSAAEWQELLREAGASDTDAWSLRGQTRAPYALVLGRWARRPRRALATSLRVAAGAWIVLADDTGLADALRARLQVEGTACTVLAERSLEAIERVLNTPEMARQPVQVVCLWPLGLETPESADGAEVTAQQVALGASLASLATALDRRPVRSARLWLVTRGAQEAAGSAASVTQAPVWGWGRTIRLEVPEVWGGLIDLDPETTVGDVETICRVLASGVKEDEFVLRGGRVHVPRLIRWRVPSAPRVQLDPEAAYLVTGGLGEIGLALASWLASCGARHLVLAGRSGLGTDPARSSAVESLTTRGVTVHIERVDVADVRQVNAMFERVRAAGRPLRGIIHAAGVAAPSLLAELDASRIEAVMRPKVAGAWNLHRESLALPLDFFVLMSSAAAIWGSRSLAAYGAANQFLDGLARHRRSVGLPALSVNWGRWEQGGMVSEEAHRWLREVGLLAFASDDGLRALGELMAAGAAQGTVAAVDWERFKAVYAVGACDALLNEVAPESPATPGAATAHAKPVVTAAPASHGAGTLLDDLREQVAQALGLSPNSVPLDESVNLLGFDSLMAVRVRDQIQRRWGVAIPVVEFLKGRSVADLAGAASPAAPPAGAPGPVHRNAPPNEVGVAGSVDDLSDGDVDAVLRRLLGGALNG